MLPYSNPNHDFAFEQAVIGMALISLDGSILKVNSALSNLLGYSQQELTAGASQKIANIRALLNQVVWNTRATQDQQQSITQFEYVYHHPSDREVYLSLRISVKEELAQSFRGYLVQFEDRTLLRQLMRQLELKEQKLNEKENSFLRLLEGLPLSVLITKRHCPLC